VQSTAGRSRSFRVLMSSSRRRDDDDEEAEKAEEAEVLGF
jgi:hypothetical protein